MQTGWEPSGSFPSALARPLSSRPCGLPARRSSTFSGRGSSSLELFLSSSVHVQSPAHRVVPSFGLSTSTRAANERLPWGFLPLRGQSEAALAWVPMPHARFFSGLPRLERRPFGLSALGVSHALGGLLRDRSCELVSSRCRVQGFSFRGFSLAADTFRLSPDLSPPGVQRPSLRFRASSIAADFRGLLPASSAVACVMGEITPAPRPSWILLSSGLPIPSPGIPLRDCLRLRPSSR
jgi:hypothetical protein